MVQNGVSCLSSDGLAVVGGITCVYGAARGYERGLPHAEVKVPPFDVLIYNKTSFIKCAMGL